MSKSSELENLAPQPAGYGAFFLEIKAQIRQRQYQAMRAANGELLALYWWLGENISQRQLALGWGKSVLQHRNEKLRIERTLPDTKDRAQTVRDVLRNLGKPMVETAP